MSDSAPNIGFVGWPCHAATNILHRRWEPNIFQDRPLGGEYSGRVGIRSEASVIISIQEPPVFRGLPEEVFAAAPGQVLGWQPNRWSSPNVSSLILRVLK